MRGARVQLQTSASWLHASACETPQVRLRLGIRDKRYGKLAALAAPGDAQTVGCFEPREVQRAIESDRKFRGAADELRQCAGRNWLSVLQDHGEDRTARALHRKSHQDSAAVVRHRVFRQCAELRIERQVRLLDAD